VVQGFVRRAAQRAELSNNGPHMLRHTFCSHLAMRGAPGRAIQELAGHQDLTTTQRYMHLSPAAIDSAIRLLDASGVPPVRGNMVATGSTETANSCR
jgi:site-specific recombinase XerD